MFIVCGQVRRLLIIFFDGVEGLNIHPSLPDLVGLPPSLAQPLVSLLARLRYREYSFLYVANFFIFCLWNLWAALCASCNITSFFTLSLHACSWSLSVRT